MGTHFTYFSYIKYTPSTGQYKSYWYRQIPIAYRFLVGYHRCTATVLLYSTPRAQQGYVHTYFTVVLFIITLKRAAKQSLPQQPTNDMRSIGYRRYKKFTYCPVEGVWRHYSRRFYIAICKRSKAALCTVGTSVESRRLGTRNVPTKRLLTRNKRFALVSGHSRKREGQKSFGTFLFQEKYNPSSPKCRKALWIQHLRLAVKQLMSTRSSALDTATALSRVTEKEYQKRRFCFDC